MGKATQNLKKEHEAILFVLRVLERIIAANDEKDGIRLNHYNDLIYFLQIFVDKCHHGKEEKYLFMELVNNGFQKEDGPLAVMMQEHMQSREHITLMSESVDRRDITGFNDAAEEYTELLKNHIEKEENIIYAMADKIIDEEAQNLLFEKFEEYEDLVIGCGVHEKLHAMIDKWAEHFDVA